jgi:hypothetical protein
VADRAASTASASKELSAAVDRDAQQSTLPGYVKTVSGRHGEASKQTSREIVKDH